MGAPTLTFFLALTAAAITLPGLARAARADETQVDLPEARLQTMAGIPQPQETPSWMEIGLSSWEPGNFSLPARIGETQAFGDAGLPSLYVNYSFPVSLLSGLKVKIGGNFLSMDRSAPLGALAETVSETVNLFSARLGAEYTPAKWEGRALEPYAGVALLPTLGVTGASSFDDGTSYFGVPIEVSLGSRLNLKKIGVPWNGADLEIGLTGTEGTVDHSSFAGFGISGGVRVLL